MIDGVPILELTPSVLLGIVILMVLTGRLVPRRTFQDMKEDRDGWRAAHRVSEEARVEISKQLDVALEVGDTMRQVLTGIQHQTKER